MIALFTDYSYQGPYVGQLHAAIQAIAPGTKVIDLMHDAPTFDPLASAYLLPAISKPFPGGTVFCCVVDPGVGSDRLPCVIKADGNFFVGPDNGLFDVIISRAQEVAWHTITWRPENMSMTFHGRDLFAPVAAMLANGDWQATEPAIFNLKKMARDYYRIIYIDGFGNVITGIQGETVNDSQKLRFDEHEICYASHFATVEPGVAFWHRNSLGLIEIAVNSGRADLIPGIEPGAEITVI